MLGASKLFVDGQSVLKIFQNLISIVTERKIQKQNLSFQSKRQQMKPFHEKSNAIINELEKWLKEKDKQGQVSKMKLLKEKDKQRQDSNMKLLKDLTQANKIKKQLEDKIRQLQIDVQQKSDRLMNEQKEAKSHIDQKKALDATIIKQQFLLKIYESKLAEFMNTKLQLQNSQNLRRKMQQYMDTQKQQINILKRQIQQTKNKNKDKSLSENDKSFKFLSVFSSPSSKQLERRSLRQFEGEFLELKKKLQQYSMIQATISHQDHKKNILINRKSQENKRLLDQIKSRDNRLSQLQSTILQSTIILLKENAQKDVYDQIISSYEEKISCLMGESNEDKNKLKGLNQFMMNLLNFCQQFDEEKQKREMRKKVQQIKNSLLQIQGMITNIKESMKKNSKMNSFSKEVSDFFKNIPLHLKELCTNCVRIMDLQLKSCRNEIIEKLRSITYNSVLQNIPCSMISVVDAWEPSQQLSMILDGFIQNDFN